MSIKAVLSWGEAEDVTICIENQSVLCMSEVGGLDKFTHGIVKDVQIALTAKEAIELGIQLITHGERCKELEKLLKEQDIKEKE